MEEKRNECGSEVHEDEESRDLALERAREGQQAAFEGIALTAVHVSGFQEEFWARF